jgi:hypothetical protein
VTAGAPREGPSLTLLLAPFTRGLVGAEQPAFMGRLERLAAERYRAWAQQFPAHADALLACAQREERIAERAERLFPMNAAQAAKLAALLPEVRRVYASLFVGLPLPDQLALQASAERQGANVWRALIASQAPPAALREELEHSARLEEESAEHLAALLAELVR